MPPPDPRSSTRSPSRSSATAVGLPQPRLARPGGVRDLGELQRGVQAGADRLGVARAAAPGRGLDGRGGVARADLLVDRLDGHRVSPQQVAGDSRAPRGRGGRRATASSRPSRTRRAGRADGARRRARGPAGSGRRARGWDARGPPTLAISMNVDAARRLPRHIDVCQYAFDMKRLVDPDALLLQGAADPTRLAILRQLAAGDGVCACDFTSCCDVAQPTVSHHLKVLRESGWVRAERRGSNVWYWLRPEALERFGQHRRASSRRSGPNARGPRPARHRVRRRPRPGRSARSGPAGAIFLIPSRAAG